MLRDQGFQIAFDLLERQIGICSRDEILVSEEFSQHPAIDEEACFEPLGEDSTSYRFTTFEPEQKELLAKQLNYLIEVA